MTYLPSESMSSCKVSLADRMCSYEMVRRDASFSEIMVDYHSLHFYTHANEPRSHEVRCAYDKVKF